MDFSQLEVDSDSLVYYYTEASNEVLALLFYSLLNIDSDLPRIVETFVGKVLQELCIQSSYV